MRIFHTFHFLSKCPYFLLLLYIVLYNTCTCVHVVKSQSIAMLVSLYTVESSLFVVDQCLWLSWVTLAQEFTSPWTYIQAIVYYLWKLSDYTTNEITSLRTRKIFGYPRILTPTNKNDCTVHVVRYENTQELHILDVSMSYKCYTQTSCKDLQFLF